MGVVILTSGCVTSGPASPSTTVTNPLALNDSYRYTSGQNELIARFAQYEIAENYGIPSSGGTAEHSFPDIILHAPKGTRFLFVYFVFENTENFSSGMPGPERFSIISDDRTYTYPINSSIPRARGQLSQTIVQVNGTRKNMHEYKYFQPPPPGSHYAPDFTWYIPYIVSDTFDPDKSYVSVRFNNDSIATWKFS
jgi:hypothetical protein